MEKKELTDGIIKGFDSTTYRRIFEFIQEEGIEPLIMLLDEVDDNTLGCFLVGGKKSGVKLSSKSRLALKYLIQAFYDSLSMRDFIRRSDSCQKALKGLHLIVDKTASNINNLDSYAANANKLESLKVLTVSFGTLQSRWDYTRISKDKRHIIAVDRQFTDGLIAYHSDGCGHSSLHQNIRYRDYRTEILPNPEVKSSPTWVLTALSDKDGEQYRHAIIKDFGFNGVLLPTNEELSEYAEPKSLKMHKELQKH
jgi:hypothetical protein